MSYVRVESSVPLHPKFLKAGPAASWLWLCGLAYCQEALTDGFIAKEALTFLGVPKPLPMAAVLVSVALWHEVDGGWQIHNYLQHNNSADYIRKVRSDRREAGKRGGRPRKHVEPQTVNLFGLLTGKQSAKHLAKQTENPSTATTVQVARSVRTEKQERADAPAFAVDEERINRLEARIRQHRRRRSRETDDGRPAESVIAALARDVLTTHPDETDDGELRELLKTACARANLKHDGQSVGNALEVAKAQVRKAVG